MKMWKGRLSGEVDKRLQWLNNSIRFDARMAQVDIKGSCAHAKMLAKIGVLTQQEAQQLVDELQKIAQELNSGALRPDEDAEDIHMFVEQVLTARLGDAGKKLHTARSRNDQVALDIRLYLMEEGQEVLGLVRELARVLCEIAEQHTETVMPGYTHLQRAQPVTLAHHLMAYVQMLLRDMGRLSDAMARMDEMPLGSGALAGTTYPLDREMVAQELGMAGITANSMDAVSDRDFVLELCGALSILMMHLSRFSEEIILWCSWEFRFVSLADAFSTGSSIMPQKKNPDLCELVRGKTARVYGDHMTLLAMMKSLPLAYNKDMQEDKEAIFDAFDTVKDCLCVFAPMLQTARFDTQRMHAAAEQGFINATDCADYLVKKGVPFREAYRITGELVNVCIAQNETLNTLPLAQYQELCPLFLEDVYEAVDLMTCVMQRKVPGGPAPQCVKQQIAQAKSALEEEQQ